MLGKLQAIDLCTTIIVLIPSFHQGTSTPKPFQIQTFTVPNKPDSVYKHPPAATSMSSLGARNGPVELRARRRCSTISDIRGFMHGLLVE